MRAYQDEVRQERTQIGELASAAAATMDQLLDERYGLLDVLATNDSFRDADTGGIADRFVEISPDRRGFSGGLGWIDASGRLRVLSNRENSALPIDVSDRQYVRTALGGERAIQVLVGRALPVPLIVLGVPTRDDAGRINGVLTGSFRLSRFTEFTDRFATNGSAVHIVDREGVVLVGGATDRLDPVRTASPYRAFRARRQGVGDADTDFVGQRDRVVGYASLPDIGWLLALSTPRDQVTATPRRALIRELIALVGAVLLGSAALTWGAGRLRRVERNETLRRSSVERLRSVAAKLIAATEPDELGCAVCDAVAAEVASDWCAVVTAVDDRTAIRARSGPVPEEIATLDLSGLDDDGTVVVPPGEQGTIDPHGVLPARTGLLVSALGDDDGNRRLLVTPISPWRQITQVERDAVEAIVEDGVQGFERTGLLMRERLVAERLAAAVRVGEAMEQAEGVVARAEALVDQLVPDFAEFATVEAADASGEIRLLAAAHRNTALVPTVVDLRLRHRVEADAGIGIAKLLGDGQSQRIAAIANQRYVAVSDATQSKLERVQAGSYLGVALTTGSTIVAGMLLSRRPDQPPFDEHDLAFAESIAARAGSALERARTLERESTIALELQTSLLPVLQDIADESVGVEYRYRPADLDLQVGGDFFDVFPLPDGTIGVAVGDVVGHGLAAAAAMGKLGSALRAIGLSQPDPARVLDELHRFAETTPGAQMATLAYAVIDPITGVMRYSVAGHPPPIIVTGAGESEFLYEGRAGPLAVATPAIRTTAACRLSEGTTVILYSDGLFERRGEQIDLSLNRLARAASRRARVPLEPMTDAILDSMTAGRRITDDIVLVALRLTSLGHRLRVRRPAVASELRGLRAEIRAWLTTVGVAGIGADDVLLAVGEALANAVEHPEPTAGRTLDVDLGIRGQILTARVHDGGRWNSDPPHADRGRGLHIMSQLSQELDIVQTQDGTTVTMIFPLSSQ